MSLATGESADFIHLVTPWHPDYCRITGDGILPVKQELVDIQAAVLNTHCPLFEYEGRGFLVSGSAPTQYSFMELMQLRGDAFNTSHSLFCLHLGMLDHLCFLYLAFFHVSMHLSYLHI